MMSTSEGPAGMSILTCASDCWTSIFAAVTYWFPGPKSLSTFGTLWVPNAIAAMACAPPAFSKWVTPAFLAMYTISGASLPSGPGGEAKTRVGQPAIMAGIANIIAVEGSIAVPPGTYRPTDSIARVCFSHVTPGMVSTWRTGWCWARWNCSIFAKATSMACWTASLSVASSVAGEPTIGSALCPSNWVFQWTTAWSPCSATRSIMGSTVLKMASKSIFGRFNKALVSALDRSVKVYCLSILGIALDVA